jgi:hypothetical protein
LAFVLVLFIIVGVMQPCSFVVWEPDVEAILQFLFLTTG